MNAAPLSTTTRASLAVGGMIMGMLAFDGAFAQSRPSQQHYDIPAQPLNSALSAFATTSGVDIVYRQSLAVGRHSSAVKGEYSAPVALQRLLQGTNLNARFSGPRSVIIYVEDAQVASSPTSDAPAALRMDTAEVRGARIIGGGDQLARRRYAMALQAALQNMLRSSLDFQGRSLRLEIRIGLNSAGEITEAVIRRSNARDDWDIQIVNRLTGANPAGAPPPGTPAILDFAIEVQPLGRSRPDGVS